MSLRCWFFDAIENDVKLVLGRVVRGHSMPQAVVEDDRIPASATSWTPPSGHSPLAKTGIVPPILSIAMLSRPMLHALVLVIHAPTQEPLATVQYHPGILCAFRQVLKLARIAL